MTLPPRFSNPEPRRSGSTIRRPRTVAEFIDLTPDLPALPTVALATQKESGKPGATAQSVGNLASADPALTARILRLANSPFYGNARQVCAVSDAVMILGMQGIRNLCLLAGTYPWLQGGLPAYGLAPGALLSHSLAAAAGCQAVAKRIGVDPETAYTAGLLHDLGKVGLGMWFKTEDGPLHDWRAERRAIGFDHAQIGGELARRWNLPVPLVNAITCHHMPCEGLEDALYVGDVIAYVIEGLEPPLPEPEPLVRCGLTVPDMVALAGELTPDYLRHKKLAEACA